MYEGSDYIRVAFDANAETKEYNFSINWVPGYTENFKVDCSKAILEDDLRTAVEPKSISLISPAKKMVVGGTQRLDVKLTKKLNDFGMKVMNTCLEHCTLSLTLDVVINVVLSLCYHLFDASGMNSSISN